MSKILTTSAVKSRTFQEMASELLRADSPVLEFHEGQAHVATKIVVIVLMGILTLKAPALPDSARTKTAWRKFYVHY